MPPANFSVKAATGIMLKKSVYNLLQRVLRECNECFCGLSSSRAEVKPVRIERLERENQRLHFHRMASAIQEVAEE